MKTADVAAQEFYIFISLVFTKLIFFLLVCVCVTQSYYYCRIGSTRLKKKKENQQYLVSGLVKPNKNFSLSS